MRMQFLPVRYLTEHAVSVVLYSKAPFLEQVTFFYCQVYTSLPSVDGIGLYTAVHFICFLFMPSF